MARLVCANCHTENTEDTRFCKKCGKRVGDDYIDPDLEQRLYERIETRLTNKWISKETVEKDMALNAATRLSEWAKLFAIAFGVPATIAVGILAFVGVKSTTDLASIEGQTAAFKKTANDVEAQYTLLKDKLPQLNQIATSLRGLEDRVGSIESAVAKFSPSSLLNNSTQVQLITALEHYTKYLKELGLAPKSVPTIHVHTQLPRAEYDAYMEGDDIYVKLDHANPAKVIHEFSHNVLLSPVPGDKDLQWSYSAIEAGVANYLTADSINSPLLDSVNLIERVPIAATRHTWVGGQSEGGMAWGSYMWALREDKYTSAKATPAIVQAFRKLKPSTPPQDYQDIFLKELVAAGLDSATVNRLLANP
ncbi:transcription initiation factor TFIIIB Brf1 subunit/transcription initiation factor TFIIB [Bradyrhizobium sp. F1.4.3]|uniref:zinc ribbon domain-containing protein n=1 Tax=Bradyrhizobium sp. F1.4.3 TaxID=3156356 RepID=UPI003399A530